MEGRSLLGPLVRGRGSESPPLILQRSWGLIPQVESIHPHMESWTAGPL